MLVQLKSSELKDLRKKWHDEQNGICPILKQEIAFEDTVCDHQHKLKAEEADETGKGICRGCISRYANAMEGKITNNYKRYGLDKYMDIPDFLRSLADYLEHNKIDEEVKYIHPNEAPSKPKLKKASYNKLIKAVDGKQKVPDFKDKKGNFTKPLQKLFEKYDVTPEFYK